MLQAYNFHLNTIQPSLKQLCFEKYIHPRLIHRLVGFSQIHTPGFAACFWCYFFETKIHFQLPQNTPKIASSPQGRFTGARAKVF